jgi:hypothetical protein
MNHTEHSLPLSLMSYFNAPDGFTGYAGMLCGYSADRGFMHQAVECFSGTSNAMRAREGDVYLAMMLDRGNEGIQDIPGLLHMGANPEAKKYLLLHAKVAVLSFRNQQSPDQWRLRLIVSTGNWTEQTLTKSLDLAWCIEVSSSDLDNRKDADVKLRCADMCAAWDLLSDLRGHHDDSLLKIQGSSTQDRFAAIEGFIEQCAGVDKAQKPRFFDNRKSSLLAQLPELVKRFSPDSRRNYLAMGSGFYESAKNGKTPEVPTAIMNSLKAAELLTQNPETDIFVNPESCQGIAESFDTLKDMSIAVRPAHIPELLFGKNSQRSLHAKFLFSANYRENSQTCNNAWVYLGSGNLTPAGFTEPMHAAKGNLEAGVVFGCDGFYWHAENSPSEYQAITHVLPIKWEKEFEADERLKAGDDMEEREEQFMAPRIPYVLWLDDSDTRTLQLPEDCQHFSTEIELLHPNSDQSPCKLGESGYIWDGDRPRLVKIRWKSDSSIEKSVPVVDTQGRIAATEYPAQSLNDALADLMGFPFPPEMSDDDDYSADDYETDGTSTTSQAGHAAQVADYPIRTVMLLVERIADKQCALTEPQWNVWCKQLENRLLHLDAECEQKNPLLFFRNQLKVNPLCPLRNPAFLPVFAEDKNSEQYKKYAATLDAIEAKWGLDAGSLSNQSGQSGDGL